MYLFPPCVNFTSLYLTSLLHKPKKKCLFLTQQIKTWCLFPTMWSIYRSTHFHWSYWTSLIIPYLGCDLVGAPYASFNLTNKAAYLVLGIITNVSGWPRCLLPPLLLKVYEAPTLLRRVRSEIHLIMRSKGWNALSFHQNFSRYWGEGWGDSNI